MYLPSTQEAYLELGFPPLESVSTLRSIAHLFGSSKNRCGIYLLEFPERKFYIGQAVEVVRRFAQHRKNYDQIIGFAFIPAPRTHLDQKERDLIHQAEQVGLVILNTVHASNVIGETDLDMVISPEEQVAWLASPREFNEMDQFLPISLPESQAGRFAKRFQKFKTHPLFLPASLLLQTYLLHCIPSPSRTEYSFWAASCLPSTNKNTSPRLLCLSAGVMELFVIGYHKNASAEMWGFVTVASDVLAETFQDFQELEEAFPSIEIVQRGYRDAGQHQLTILAESERSFRSVLEHQAVQRAAAVLAIRVMRKRATIYSKFHCKQLIDVLESNNA